MGTPPPPSKASGGVASLLGPLTLAGLYPNPTWARALPPGVVPGRWGCTTVPPGVAGARAAGRRGAAFLVPCFVCAPQSCTLYPALMLPLVVDAVPGLLPEDTSEGRCADAAVDGAKCTLGRLESSATGVGGVGGGPEVDVDRNSTMVSPPSCSFAPMACKISSRLCSSNACWSNRSTSPWITWSCLASAAFAALEVARSWVSFSCTSASNPATADASLASLLPLSRSLLPESSSLWCSFCTLLASAAARASAWVSSTLRPSSFSVKSCTRASACVARVSDA
mmetsp:Transcript_32426/g.62304  ORF Transcript_32426/g.62304 Transcript_32426/m.62304 type:complete len:282 (-) Transcript_32426:1252-2097(-)